MKFMNTNLQDDDVDWILDDDPEEDSEDLDLDQYDSINAYQTKGFIENYGIPIADAGIDIFEDKFGLPDLIGSIAKAFIHTLDE